MRRWIRSSTRAVGVLILTVPCLGEPLALARPRPEGAAGPEAEALADRVADAVGGDAWIRTGAVRWTVLGHSYLWDRERNLVRYEDDRGVVLTEGWRPMGRAFGRDGEQVGGRWKDRRVDRAYAAFVNAAFLAFAPTMLRSSGASVARVDDALLVSYPTGGVTPGDAYLWEIGSDGLPVAFRIWAGALPLPGARLEWSDWVRLDTGARVATTRRLGPVTLTVTELAAAPTLAGLVPGEDPFAPMFAP